jgi:arginase
MTLDFVLVPQWQGSPSARAMRLADGVAALRDDLPSAATHEVAVPLEAGDEQGTGIARFSSLQLVRERLTDVLGDLDAPWVVIGGDCAVSDAAVRHAAGSGTPPALVWCDAQPDLNSPTTSPSGAYAGMVLRSLIDDGTVAPDRVVLAGARSWDPGEESYAAERGIRALDVADLEQPDGLVAAVAASGADRVFLHIDLDVLDPPAFASLLEPEPFGLDPGRLVAAVRALLARFTLAGATIAAFAPGTPEDAIDDAPTLLRLIGALGSERTDSA